MEKTKLSSAEVQKKLLAHLRYCNYIPQRTSELSTALGIQSSAIRRAGLYLANHGRLRADLVKHGGRKEYLFTLEQLDLFEDNITTVPSLFSRLKSFVLSKIK